MYCTTPSTYSTAANSKAKIGERRGEKTKQQEEERWRSMGEGGGAEKGQRGRRGEKGEMDNWFVACRHVHGCGLSFTDEHQINIMH